ncbi:MAG: c-type cytochrome biogenesis protein CcmI, partial [Betaproteobacteria bacterium]|nr:c-type cytochrome biogenesis protein CcmI [Betaproteobacteria bacterium]
AVPLTAIALYLVVGSPQMLSPQQTAAGGEAHGVSAQQIEALIGRVAARLKENPEDAEGWVILARSYSVLGRFPEAARAYANAVARIPRDAQLLADYADALAMAQGRRLQGEPENVIARALEIDPSNLKALALAGSVEFEKKQYASAASYWERILPLIPGDSDMVRSIQASIAEARSLAGDGSRQPPRQANAGDSRAGVSGVVKLAPELAAKVAPTDTVFIFARAADGPRMPLATLRKQAGDLPVKFSLDDTMAMTREMKLSSFPQVVVGARISKSANATPQPGDLQGISPPISSRATGVTIVINSEVR